MQRVLAVAIIVAVTVRNSSWARLSIVASGISRSAIIANVEKALGVPVINQTVPEDYYADQNFTPPIKIERIMIIIESSPSILVGPSYPMESYFPGSMIAPASLEATLAGPGIIRFKGTNAMIIAAIYAMKMVVRFEAPGVFSNLVLDDRNNIIPQFDPAISLKSIIRDGKYFVVANSRVLRVFPLILGAFRQIVTPIRNNEVVDLKSYVEKPDGTAEMAIFPSYHQFITAFLEKEPEVVGSVAPSQITVTQLLQAKTPTGNSPQPEDVPAVAVSVEKESRSIEEQGSTIRLTQGKQKG